MSPIEIIILVAVIAANFAMGAATAKIVREQPALRAEVEEMDYVFYVIFGILFLPIALHQRHHRCLSLRLKG